MKNILTHITIFTLLTGTNVLWAQQIGFVNDWQAVIRKYNSLEGIEVSSTNDGHSSYLRSDFKIYNLMVVLKIEK